MRLLLLFAFLIPLRLAAQNDSVYLAELPRINVYRDIPMVGKVPVTSRMQFTRLSREDLRKMHLVLKACSRYDSDTVRVLPNGTRVVYCKTLRPEIFPDGTYLVHPGPTVLVFSPNRKYFYVFSQSQIDGRFDFRVYFRAVDKDSEIVDPSYADAGDAPVDRVWKLVFGHIQK